MADLPVAWKKITRDFRERGDMLIIPAKGDKVLIRWTNSGTNTGPLFGNSPTGKAYVATAFDLFRISNGKIIELWQQYNFASWP
jgi:predicted ester cyclase